MSQLTQSELLTRVKKALGITGTYQDDTLQLYIDEAKDYMLDAGVNIAIISSTLCVGVICRGVADLWNYGAGNAQLSQYFKERVVQLTQKSDDEIVAQLYSLDEILTYVQNHIVFPTPSGSATVTGLEFYPNGAGIIKGSRILLSDDTVVNSTMITPESLTLTSTANGNIGETAVTVSPALTEGNSYKIKAEFGTTLAVPAECEDISDWTDWDGSSVINAANNYRLVVAECNVSGKVIKAGYVTVAARIF